MFPKLISRGHIFVKLTSQIWMGCDADILKDEQGRGQVGFKTQFTIWTKGEMVDVVEAYRLQEGMEIGKGGVFPIGAYVWTVLPVYLDREEILKAYADFLMSLAKRHTMVLKGIDDDDIPF
jgi:hypothetical protein